jgi:hypothetical protein
MLLRANNHYFKAYASMNMCWPALTEHSPWLLRQCSQTDGLACLRRAPVLLMG